MINVTYAPRGIRFVMLQEGATEPGATTVTGIPNNLAAQVASHLSRIVFWPSPKQILYDALMAIKQGAIIMNYNAHDIGVF